MSNEATKGKASPANAPEAESQIKTRTTPIADSRTQPRAERRPTTAGHPFRMPVIFVGRGSPLNAIDRNPFSAAWLHMGERLAALPERPRAIICVSAHWMTDGFRTTDTPRMRQINDMYGFPPELYEVHYEPSGDPALAHRIVSMAKGLVGIDNSWGLDHGAWSPLVRLFPKADIPVVPVSVAPRLSPTDHFRLGRELRALRDEGALIVASGNVVHSFHFGDFSEKGVFPWAQAFDDKVRKAVASGDWERVCNPTSFGKDARRAFQTPEHYLPLPAALGAAWEGEPVEVWCEGGELGAFTMTSYAFGMPE